MMFSTKLIDQVEVSFNFNLTCGATMEACFGAFDKNSDGKLDHDEFKDLCSALFRNAKNESYEIQNDMLAEVFAIFDENNDGYIDKEEFGNCWNDWIKTIVRPVSALLVVDVQNDFITGTLDIRNCPAKHDGNEVVPLINTVLSSVGFEIVIYTYDWHPSDHVSFIDNLHLRKLHESSPISCDKVQICDTVIFEGNPPMEQRLWPRHCVQNTWGSQLHKDLMIVDNSIKIYKGTNPEVDSYSAFWDNKKLTDTRLDAQLKAKNVTDVYVCGLAYDVCVGATAADAIVSGYRTALIDDCSRGVDLLDIEKTKSNITNNNGVIVHSSEIKDMISGADRRPELGLKLALQLKHKRQHSNVVRKTPQQRQNGDCSSQQEVLVTTTSS